MQKFEYRVIALPVGASEEVQAQTLGILGDEGWELVAVESGHGTHSLYCKRPVAPSSAP